MAAQELADNRILRSLPASTLDGIRPLLTVATIEARTVLQPAGDEIRDCYFPLRGMGSLLVSEASGRSVDTAIVGSEGFIGLPVFLGTGRMPVEAMVQLDMRAAVIGADDLRRALSEEPPLANLLQRYTQMVLVEIARLVLCNRVHSVEQRIARWLLQVNDRVGIEVPLEITHQFLSEMVGGERPSTSVVVERFAKSGLIETSRGVITIVDADRLEAGACDCYRTIRDELDRLLEQNSQHDVAGR
jgi:CRP-like cAMP-binding protein